MAIFERRYPEDRNGSHDISKCTSCPARSEICDEILKYEKAHHNRTNHTKRDSLCWCCKYSVHRQGDDYICPWANYGKPVDGWIANTHKTAMGELHAAVVDCPNFKRYAEWMGINGFDENT